MVRNPFVFSIQSQYITEGMLMLAGVYWDASCLHNSHRCLAIWSFTRVWCCREHHLAWRKSEINWCRWFCQSGGNTHFGNRSYNSFRFLDAIAGTQCACGRRERFFMNWYQVFLCALVMFLFVCERKRESKREPHTLCGPTTECYTVNIECNCIGMLSVLKWAKAICPRSPLKQYASEVQYTFRSSVCDSKGSK